MPCNSLNIGIRNKAYELTDSEKEKMCPRNRDVSSSKGAGYRVRLRESLPDRLKCPLCQHLMRHPVQTYRGELACSYCYDVARSERSDGKCPLDGEALELHQIFRDKGKQNEINALQCFCSYRDNNCQWEGKVLDVDEHQQSCTFRPMKCDFCQEDVYRENLVVHLATCKNWNTDRRCVYYGCTFKPENAKNLETHFQNSSIHHAMLHNSLMKNNEELLANRVEEVTRSYAESENRMKNDIELMKKQLSELMNFTQDLNAKYDSIKLERDEETSRSQKNENESKQTNSSHPTDNLESKNLLEVVNILNGNVSDISLQQRLFENTTHDGSLLWKIDQFSHRLHEAVVGKVTALHSAPIYTSKYGYKLCARLYLNGDGVGKCSHLSLFMVLMKSEYDNVLEWPFKKKVTFKLINQNNRRRDITDNFIPDINSASWQKPKKQMNIASGCPLFVPKETLLNGDFVKDDTLFIEISVS